MEPVHRVVTVGVCAADFNLDAHLDVNFLPLYDQARTAAEIGHGRLPADLRSNDAPLRNSHNGRPLTLGQQLPLYGRSTTFVSFIYNACLLAKTLKGSGDYGVQRGTALIALIGAPGAGETLVYWGCPYAGFFADVCMCISSHFERYHS